MPERIARIIRREIDFDRIQRHYIDHILLQSADLLLADTGNLKRMPVQMNGMLISAAIAQDKSVAFAPLNHKRIDLRPGLIVDGPGIELRFPCRPISRNVSVNVSSGFVAAAGPAN